MHNNEAFEIFTIMCNWAEGNAPAPLRIIIIICVYFSYIGAVSRTPVSWGSFLWLWLRASILAFIGIYVAMPFSSRHFDDDAVLSKVGEIRDTGSIHCRI